ncbi:hypothetical protein DIPPA_19766 [Diplonema papillatum]|nr:hypothetical protein DIPPA_19766 [Diplonema papillatum]
MFMTFMDLFTAIKMPSYYASGTFVVAVLWTTLITVEDCTRFGLYDLPGIPDQEARQQALSTSCSELPCVQSLSAALTSQGIRLALLFLNYMFMREFASTLQHDKDASAAATDAVREIAHHISRFDLDPAKERLAASEEELHGDLVTSLRSILENLEGYKRFLPQSCLPNVDQFSDHSSSSVEDLTADMTSPNSSSLHPATEDTGSTNKRTRSFLTLSNNHTSFGGPLRLLPVTLVRIALCNTPKIPLEAARGLSIDFSRVAARALEVLGARKGIVEFFEGDTILASYNAVKHCSRHCVCAAEAAVECYKDVTANDDMESPNTPVILRQPSAWTTTSEQTNRRDSPKFAHPTQDNSPTGSVVALASETDHSTKFRKQASRLPKYRRPHNDLSSRPTNYASPTSITSKQFGVQSAHSSSHNPLVPFLRPSDTAKDIRTIGEHSESVSDFQSYATSDEYAPGLRVEALRVQSVESRGGQGRRGLDEADVSPPVDNKAWKPRSSCEGTAWAVSNPGSTTSMMKLCDRLQMVSPLSGSRGLLSEKEGQTFVLDKPQASYPMEASSVTQLSPSNSGSLGGGTEAPISQQGTLTLQKPWSLRQRPGGSVDRDDASRGRSIETSTLTDRSHRREMIQPILYDGPPLVASTGLRYLRVHVSVTSGRAFCGDFGCSTMQRFAAVGAPATLGAALAWVAGGSNLPIVCNEAVYREVKHFFEVRLLLQKLGHAQLGGPVSIFEILVSERKAESGGEWMYELQRTAAWDVYNEAVEAYRRDDMDSALQHLQRLLAGGSITDYLRTRHQELVARIALGQRSPPAYAYHHPLLEK